MTRSRVNEMEFLDIYSIKTIAMLFTVLLQKAILYSGFKNPYKKICETRKFESVHALH